MINLLFIKHKGFNARTVENDVSILSEKYSVTMYGVNTSKGTGFFIAFIKEIFYLLLNIYRFKVVFIWFADYHSMPAVFFAKLTGKVSIVNIGGYDADEILQSSPKNLKEKFRKFCVLYTVKNSTRLLPVSDVIRSYLEKVVSPSKCTTAYCCIDENKFPPPEVIPKKENLVITVGGGGEFVKEAKRKRLDFFIELGEEFNKRYPEYNTKFYAIGHDDNTNTFKYLSGLIRSSSTVLKPITRTPEELIEYFNRASIYMQLSYYEAFGIAQAEAMLYGCIPVSNPGGAIPEVIGDAGFTIKNYDISLYITRIKEILDGTHEELRTKAQKRVLDNFSLSIRRDKVLKIIDSLLV